MKWSADETRNIPFKERCSALFAGKVKHFTGGKSLHFSLLLIYTMS
jgi:hypothetical protein